MYYKQNNERGVNQTIIYSWRELNLEPRVWPGRIPQHELLD